jgi:tRNA nucleotidyltransferase (CCA-adding enzyme)
MKGLKARIPDIVKTIAKTLEDRGFEAYIVGGAVRDMVMAREAVDWDVATSASVETVSDLFPQLSRFSLQHGTITLVHEGRHYEVSSFRGLLPTLEDDLRHRDFTINAMAFHPGLGKLIDPHGGLKDAKAGLVRAVGAPEDRFREDPLRLLRAVRISCELDFRIYGNTLEAMRRLSPLIQCVAKERIRDELIKILVCRKPSRGLSALARTGLLDEIVPELIKLGTPRHLFETVDHVHPQAAVRLAALFLHMAGTGGRQGPRPEAAGTAEEVMRRLRFSERMIFEVTHLVGLRREAMNYDPSWDESRVRRLAGGMGAEHIESFFSLCRAGFESRAKDTRLLSDFEERVRSSIESGFPHRVQDLKVDGRKVMQIFGIDEGPEVGRILDELLEEVLDHPEWNTEEKLLERLREMKKKQ